MICKKCSSRKFVNEDRLCINCVPFPQREEIRTQIKEIVYSVRDALVDAETPKEKERIKDEAKKKIEKFSVHEVMREDIRRALMHISLYN